MPPLGANSGPARNGKSESTRSQRKLSQPEENIKKKILFVDHENACPSVIAEAIWKHMGPNMALGWTAASAGISVRQEGGPMHAKTSQVLKQFAVPEYGKKMRKFRSEDFESFGTILCCDDSSLEHIKNWGFTGDNPPNIQLLGDFHKDGTCQIEDPVTCSRANFRDCYWLCYRGVQGFLRKIKEDAANAQPEPPPQPSPPPVKKTVKKKKKKAYDTVNYSSVNTKWRLIELKFEKLQVFLPCPPTVFAPSCVSTTPSPPQFTVVDSLDRVNFRPKLPTKVFVPAIHGVGEVCTPVSISPSAKLPDWHLSPPQPPPRDVQDTVNFPPRQINKKFLSDLAESGPRLSDKEGKTHQISNFSLAKTSSSSLHQDIQLHHHPRSHLQHDIQQTQIPCQIDPVPPAQFTRGISISPPPPPDIHLYPPQPPALDLPDVANLCSTFQSQIIPLLICPIPPLQPPHPPPNSPTSGFPDICLHPPQPPPIASPDQVNFPSRKLIKVMFMEPHTAEDAPAPKDEHNLYLPSKPTIISFQIPPLYQTNLPNLHLDPPPPPPLDLQDTINHPPSKPNKTFLSDTTKVLWTKSENIPQTLAQISPPSHASLDLAISFSTNSLCLFVLSPPQPPPLHLNDQINFPSQQNPKHFSAEIFPLAFIEFPPSPPSGSAAGLPYIHLDPPQPPPVDVPDQINFPPPPHSFIMFLDTNIYFQDQNTLPKALTTSANKSVLQSAPEVEVLPGDHNEKFLPFIVSPTVSPPLFPLSVNCDQNPFLLSPPQAHSPLLDTINYTPSFPNGNFLYTNDLPVEPFLELPPPPPINNSISPSFALSPPLSGLPLELHDTLNHTPSFQTGNFLYVTSFPSAPFLKPPFRPVDKKECPVFKLSPPLSSLPLELPDSLNPRPKIRPIFLVNIIPIPRYEPVIKPPKPPLVLNRPTEFISSPPQPPSPSFNERRVAGMEDLFDTVRRKRRTNSPVQKEKTNIPSPVSASKSSCETSGSPSTEGKTNSPVRSSPLTPRKNLPAYLSTSTNDSNTASPVAILLRQKSLPLFQRKGSQLSSSISLSRKQSSTPNPGEILAPISSFDSLPRKQSLTQNLGEINAPIFSQDNLSRKESPTPNPEKIFAPISLSVQPSRKQSTPIPGDIYAPVCSPIGLSRKESTPNPEEMLSTISSAVTLSRKLSSTPNPEALANVSRKQSLTPNSGDIYAAISSPVSLSRKQSLTPNPGEMYAPISSPVSLSRKQSLTPNPGEIFSPFSAPISLSRKTSFQTSRSPSLIRSRKTSLLTSPISSRKGSLQISFSPITPRKSSLLTSSSPEPSLINTNEARKYSVMATYSPLTSRKSAFQQNVSGERRVKVRGN